MARLLYIPRERPADASAQINRQQQTFATLWGVVNDFLARVGEAPVTPFGYERINAAINVQRVLEGLNETVADRTQAICQVGDNAQTRRLMGNVVEGLDAFLQITIEEMGRDAMEEREFLLQMRNNRGDLMQRLRRDYLAGDATLSASDKTAILMVTSSTERASGCWIGWSGACRHP